MSPLVSIITPTYNSAKYIEETIKSVLNQTYKNWEMLITDDCSTDNTISIINKYLLIDSRIKLFKLNENSGSGPARNLSIENATGKYIAFLDSDDIWISVKLEKQVKFMEDYNVSFSHSSYGYINELGIEIKSPFLVSSYPIKYEDLLKRTEISCLTAIYNQEIIGKMYMPNLKRKQDYALWLSILKRGFVSIPQQDILAYYRQREGSATQKKYNLIIKHFQFLHKHENLSYFESLIYSGYWIGNGLLKYYL